MADEKRTLLELCGSVEHVTYHNDKNQYTVLDLATEAGVVTVVGMFPFVSEGEELRVYGTTETPESGDNPDSQVGAVCSGSMLMYAGYILPHMIGDAPSLQLHLTRLP